MTEILHVLKNKYCPTSQISIVVNNCDLQTHMTQTHKPNKKRIRKIISIYIKILLYIYTNIYQKSCIFAQAWLISKKKILCSLKNTPCLWLYNLSADLTKKIKKKKYTTKAKKSMSLYMLATIRNVTVEKNFWIFCMIENFF